ncbi:hypothetical protein GH714_035648 [Hevea brasiliensis]|uniref:3'-5' exonuclease domain-containing protein n=1 Tax=Hevea brasiliensis TaxID=3981 RepID=A0A6A6KT32_HEVBR|nr:hypothetical protein GH714_035648 [Hevea brasiliensis]
MASNFHTRQQPESGGNTPTLHQQKLPHLPNLPSYLHSSSLRNALSNPNIIYTGVRISGDTKKLYKDYDLETSCEADIASLAAQAFDHKDFKRSGLKTLVETIIGEELEKPKRVTMSNWDAKYLTPAQVKQSTRAEIDTCFSNNKVDEMGELGSDQEKHQIGVNKYHDYYYYCTFDEHVAHLCESVPAHGEDGGQPLNLKVDENNDGMVLSTKEDTESEFDYYLLSIYGDDEYIADMLNLKVDENNSGTVLSSKKDVNLSLIIHFSLYMVRTNI